MAAAGRITWGNRGFYAIVAALLLAGGWFLVYWGLILIGLATQLPWWGLPVVPFAAALAAAPVGAFLLCAGTAVTGNPRPARLAEPCLALTAALLLTAMLAGALSS